MCSLRASLIAVKENFVTGNKMEFFIIKSYRPISFSPNRDPK